MNEGRSEKYFVKECKSMSYESLEIYIRDCLETLRKDKFTEKSIPREKETYDSLVDLLNELLFSEVKKIGTERFKIQEKIRSGLVFNQNINDFYKKENLEIEVKKRVEKYEFLIVFLETALVEITRNEKLYEDVGFLEKLLKIAVTKKKRKEELQTLKNLNLTEKKKRLEHLIAQKIHKHEAMVIGNESQNFQSGISHTNITEYFRKQVMKDVQRKFYILKKNHLRNRESELESLKQKDNKLRNEELSLKEKIERSNKLKRLISLRRLKKEVFDGIFQKVTVKKISWRFFPKGEWSAESIIKIFGNYVSRDETIDEQRLRKIIDCLNPSVCYISEDSFNRYIAFCFDWTEKVVLECPIYGNAIYIIKGNWQEVTKFSKWEARREYSNQLTVINHSESWFERLRTNLNRKI